MKRKMRWFGALLLAGAVGAAALPSLSALGAERPPKGGKEPPRDVVAEKSVARLALAFQLADFGRTYQAPDSLVMAAGLLLETPPVTGTIAVKPETEFDKDAPRAEPVEVEKPRGLKAQAEDLIAEARKLAGDDPGVEALVKAVSNKSPKGVLGGPRQVSRGLAPGQTDIWRFTFAGQQLARVAVRASGPVHAKALRPNGSVLAEDTCSAGSVSWVPDGTKTFTFRVHNPTGRYVSYSLYTN